LARVGQARNHAFGRHGDSLDDALDGSSLKGNFVNDLDEGEIVHDVLGRDELVGVSCRDGTLKLLAVEEIGLDLVPEASAVLVGVLGVLLWRLASPGKGLRALAVASAVARGDEVGHPAGFRKGVVSDTVKEHVAKLGHLPETHSQKSGLGVSTEANSVHKAGPQCDNVLESSANLGSGNVGNVLDSEVGRTVEKLSRHLVGGRTKIGGKGRLAHLSLGDLGGNVGAHENSAREIVSHGFGNTPGDEDGGSCFFAKVCGLQCEVEI